MRIIDLNAENWKSILDFYDALLPALGAPAWHGHSVNAIIDSMIWGGNQRCRTALHRTDFGAE